MAPSITFTTRDNIPINGLPYQIGLALTGSGFLIALVTLTYTYHRLRATLANSALLAQLAYRLRGALAERDGQIADLEVQLCEYEKRFAEVFVVGEDEDEPPRGRDPRPVPMEGPLEAKVAKVVSQRATFVRNNSSRGTSRAGIGD